MCVFRCLVKIVFAIERNLVVRVELVLRLHLRLQLFVGSLQLGVVPVDRLYLIVGQVVVPRDEGLVVVYFLFLKIFLLYEYC